MLKLLKRLFSVFFLRKKNEKPQILIPKSEILREQPPEVRAEGERPKENIKERIRDYSWSQRGKKWRMPNNRLHIQYNGKVLNDNLRGNIESMRVTNFERAKEIIRGIDSYCIRQAIFQDKSGEQFKIA